MNTVPLLSIRAFLGKNNYSDSTRVLATKDKAYLTECLNVDIDDDLMVHRRAGYGSAIYIGTKIHSLWANGDIGLFVDNGNLMMIDSDGSFPLIKENVGDAPFSYVYVPPFIYLTNGHIIGYIKDKTYYDFEIPDDATYKKIMPAGHLIEWFNGRLLVARDTTIYYSDAVFPGIMDERKNFIMFGSRITMLAAVETGVWVSEKNNRTYFLAGSDIKDSILLLKENSGAIEGTAVKTNSQNVDNLRAQGTVVIWTSPNGVFIGSNEGFLLNATKGVYVPQSATSGCAVLRKNGNYNQYLVTLKD